MIPGGLKFFIADHNQSAGVSNQLGNKSTLSPTLIVKLGLFIIPSGHSEWRWRNLVIAVTSGCCDKANDVKRTTNKDGVYVNLKNKAKIITHTYEV